MRLPIYFDNMATTPVDPEVLRVMLKYLTQDGAFGNASSVSHRYGFEAEQAVKKARRQVAELIRANVREIIWTSGATEANNLAIKGAAHFYYRKGKHLITLKTEHKSVLDACDFLESEGYTVTYLTPNANGILDPAILKAAMRPDTVLVSIMHVNNETGVIQDIAALGAIVHQYGALFHVDAVQSVGKIPIDLQSLPVDLMSFSAHKVYGPKGMGALYVRYKPRVHLIPLIHGGGQEFGLRSGTLAVHQIAGMGAAFQVAQEREQIDAEHVQRLSERLWNGIVALGGVHLNGDLQHKIPGCLNVRFELPQGDPFVNCLTDLAVSSGSACNSANPEPSHVLTAMGLSRASAQNSVRFSLGRFNTVEEVDYAIAYLTDKVHRLRTHPSVWERVKQSVV